MTNKLTEKFDVDILCCPICSGEIKLNEKDNTFKCVNQTCATIFPIYNNVPCILNEEHSIFTNEDFEKGKDIFFKLKENKINKMAKALVPDPDLNVAARANYKDFGTRLTQNSNSKKKVLVLGGSIIGVGMQDLLNNFPSIEFVETDVSFGPRTMLICDAHDLPFKDGVFDGIIVQAVLEHVVDPYICVKEMYRVLNNDGIVYAETPFMQQVHGRQFDFTRFTHLGHRRLFRNFEELNSGACCGPGMALAWSYRYFLLSFSTNNSIRKILTAFSKFTSFYLKYFDYLLINKKGALDAASGYFFMGRKSSTALSDKELLKLYKGAF